MLDVKYNIEGQKLTLLPIYVIKNQKSMQSIVITLPKTTQKETEVVVPETPVVTKPVYKIVPRGEQFLEKVADISDPALIPFLTASKNTNPQIETLVNYLIDKVKIANNFEVVLINQIKYGVRLVLQTDDNKFFEAILTSDSSAPQLLSWRRISTVSDVNP